MMLDASHPPRRRYCEVIGVTEESKRARSSWFRARNGRRREERVTGEQQNRVQWHFRSSQCRLTFVSCLEYLFRTVSPCFVRFLVLFLQLLAFQLGLTQPKVLHRCLGQDSLDGGFLTD